MIKVFRVLLDNMQDTMHFVEIYSGMQEIMKYKCHNKTYISDELHTRELCNHHGIKFQVGGLDGKYIFQMCQLTGSQSWRTRD
jgi:hypothetical protein